MAMGMRMQQTREQHLFSEADRAALRRAVAYPELAPSGIDRLHLLAARYRRAGQADAALLCFYLARMLRPSHPEAIADLLAYRAERRVLLPRIRVHEAVGPILDLFASLTATHRRRVLQVARARIARVHVVNALGVIALFHSAGKTDPGLQVRCGCESETVVLFTTQPGDGHVDYVRAHWESAAWHVASREGRYTLLNLSGLSSSQRGWLKQDVARSGHRVVHSPWLPARCAERWASPSRRG